MTKRKNTRGGKKQEEDKKNNKNQKEITQIRRKTTGMKKENQKSRKKGNDGGESEAEAPKKTNTANKHKKLNRTMKNLKYSVHNKNSIIKMVEKDLLSRSEKAKKSKQFSLCT